MGPKHVGGLWVYIGAPLPNPSGNTGVMVCLFVFLFILSEYYSGSPKTVRLGVAAGHEGDGGTN